MGSDRTYRRVAALAAAVSGVALAVALGTATSAAQDGMVGSPARVVHDPAYFRAHVLPLLARQCAGCHEADDPENKSKHRLVPPTPSGAFTDEAVEANYRMYSALVDARAPERSLLLAKLLPPSRGGVDHDGGKADDVDLPRVLVDPKGPLVAWIFGATATSTPPLAVTAPVGRTVTSGDEVALDATLSTDADGDAVTVLWEIVEAPQGARARIEDPQAKRTRIVPDRDGPWTLRCRVSDGRLSGWPDIVRFAVVRPAEAPTPGGDVTPLVEIDTRERRLTRALHLDLWGRAPTTDELARTAALPWAERVDRLLATRETWQSWFDEEAFYFLLIDQFRPVSDRLAALPDKLRLGEASFREAHVEFALSAEFNARNPGNDTYATVVLEQFLGVEVQKAPKVLAAAKQMYDGQPARLFDRRGDNQSDVIRIALTQRQYVDLFTRRMEVRYLGEALPPPEHAAAVAELELDPLRLRDLLREWLLSERYTSEARAPKAKTDHQFIRTLFVDLLGRPPAYEEFRNMRNALQALADPTPVRGVLAKVLLDSSATLPPTGTATADQVRSIFQRFLGRDPSRPELEAFVAVLREPGATWRTAALAMLTSPQYQYY